MAMLHPGLIESAQRSPRKKILIVEDNPLNAKLLFHLLEAHGFEILQTEDGLQVLPMARKHHPDLILMDVQLPYISGLELTKWLKRDYDLRMIPVIAVTAFSMKGDEEKVRESGCDGYIAKPIALESFLQTVNRFVSRDIPPQGFFR